MPIKLDLIAELRTDLDARVVLMTRIKQAVKDALAKDASDTRVDHQAGEQRSRLTVPSFIAKRCWNAELDQLSLGNGHMRRLKRAALEQWLRERGITAIAAPHLHPPALLTQAKSRHPR